MNDFLNYTSAEQRLFIIEAAARRGISSVIIEKDFWVCFTLDKLFRSSYGEHITFKGGTSLSKAYKIIDRFSEDIDLTLDKKFINSFGKATSVSPSKISKQCKKVIKEHLLPDIQEMLKDYGTCVLDPNEDQTILFSYRSCLAAEAHDYIPKHVKIELGARGQREPNSRQIITPYIAEILPQIFENGLPAITVTTLSAERTFWEKATILHSIAHQPEERKLQPRMCRHYHDLHSISQHLTILEAALSDIDLLNQVVLHKHDYFKEPWDWYPTAVRGSFKLVPPDHLLKDLRVDYQKTAAMFFDEPIAYEELIKGLRQLESQIND
ncbi:nucleotidyl transferase AbiEii/AbiGii toxin family protein [Paremcibacter congregatus]|uniref:nucleotidyl transferase AbiEii/AbiGii toxin family protein n=1 Tax=Paremcibacter congregatus TaxID=2043170 RepID=UPI0030EC4458|tara:strand:- start:1118 stop:2089 length:972 start_codon:yes stop_codon:yes gene_type:complete